MCVCVCVSIHSTYTCTHSLSHPPSVRFYFQVLGSFTLFLCWYAPFILAFGIGFYIMLHSPDAGFFSSPWLALVKTSTMFVGELEFADLPIQQGSTESTKY